MAENIGKDYSQVNACNTFVKNLVEVPINGKKIDITEWDANSVIGLLKAIVKDESYILGSTFNLEIKNTSATNKEDISFQLFPNPTKDQPGNGMVTKKNTKPLNYTLLSTKLRKKYRNDTCSFAKDIKRVFADNSEIFNVPEVTRNAYMILLFEIGRRLVKKSGTPRKTSLDELPIASAITRLVQLMEAEKCTFADVFSQNGKFNCFIGEPDDRKKAISRINDVHSLNEIKQMFAPGQTETQAGVEAGFQGLNIKNNVRS